MILNIQQNAGPAVYAPPPPPQAAPAPVFIQQQQKSNTCCIVVTTICCVVCIIPVVIYGVFVLMFLNAASNDASQFPDSSFNYSTSTYTTSTYPTSTYPTSTYPTSTYTTSTSTFAPGTFINAGLLSYSANICNGNFAYTATGSGSLTSPNYPAMNYPNNMNCINRIETASDGVTFQINAFYTEAGYDFVVFNGAYTFDGYNTSGGLQVGDRFSFSDSQVEIHFTSDHVIQYPGFNFSVIDGYEPHNDISFLGYVSRIINKEDLPRKTI